MMEFWFFCLLAAAALVAKEFRLPAAATVLTKRDHDKEFSVHLGEVIQIELEEKGGNGYLWEFRSFDKEHLVIVNIKTGKPLRSAKPGQPTPKIWQIRAQKPGKTQVTLLYHRPWEEVSKAAETFTVSLNID